MGVNALFRQGRHPVLWVIQGAFYTAISVAVLAAQRRRASRAAGTDPRGLAELSRKIRHREVPSDPGERASMRAVVDDQLGRLERKSRWLPYSLGFMGLVAAALVVLGAAAGSLALPLVIAAALVGFCCSAVWMRGHALDRYRYMRAALQEERERVS